MNGGNIYSGFWTKGILQLNLTYILFRKTEFCPLTPSDEKLSQGTEVRFEGLTSLAEVPLDKMLALDTLIV